MEEFAIRKPRRGSMRAALNKTKKGTPSEQAAIKLGKKAAKKALEEGSTPAQAKAIGKKLSMSQMDTNRSKTNVEALWLAASAVPIGGAVAKGAQAVKALGNLGAKKAIRKKAAKAMEGTPSKSNTPFRSRKGNENKSQKALESKPKTTAKKTPPSSTQTIKQRAEKAIEGTPSKSNTPFRSRKGNENKSQKALESKPKLGPSSYTPPQGKALVKLPQGKAVAKSPQGKALTVYKPPPGSKGKGLTKTQIAALVAAGVAIPTYLATRGKDGKNIREGFNPKESTKKVGTPTGKMSASEARKLDSQTADEVGAKKIKPIKKSKPDTRKTLMEAMFGGFKTGDFTARDQELKDGTMLTYDFPDSDDMKKGGKVRRRMGGKVRGYGKAQRGY